MNKILIVTIIFIIIIVFKSWLSLEVISARDFPFIYKSMLEIFSISPYAWSSTVISGMGISSIPFLWNIYSFSLPVHILGDTLNLQWNIVQRIAFLYPFLILSTISPFILFKKIFPKNNFPILASAIYTLNSYILMVIGGGQIQIGLAYAIAPLIFLCFISLLEKIKEAKWKEKSERALTAGLLLSAQAIVDLRITYITLTGILILLLINYIQEFNKKQIISLFLYSIIIPLIVLLLTHAFWIVPAIMQPANTFQELGVAFNSQEAVKFFSFAKFENTISLLHPNWPENIFGKVNFMRAEFLLLPILAFASLLFINKNTKKIIIFFSLLSLIGAFLAKGVNAPFEHIYYWLFEYIPGFKLFRDPTKWYILVSISYAMLIPFSISQIHKLLKKRTGKFISHIFILLVITYICSLIKPALLGEIGGTLKSTQIPVEYTKLEKFLSQQDSFSRTLWLPTMQRFTYYSPPHPAIDAYGFFEENELKELTKKIDNKDSERKMQEAGIKYIIIPYDSEKEIFLSDRRYYEKKHQEVINAIDKIKWLKKIEGFKQLRIYQITNPKNHFWSLKGNSRIDFQYYNPTKYQVNIKNAQKNDRLIFSENYDQKWEAILNNQKITSTKYNKKYNSFILPKDGNYTLKIVYGPQIWVEKGIIISSISITAILIYLAILKISI